MMAGFLQDSATRNGAARRGLRQDHCPRRWPAGSTSRRSTRRRWTAGPGSPDGEAIARPTPLRIRGVIAAGSGTIAGDRPTRRSVAARRRAIMTGAPPARRRAAASSASSGPKTDRRRCSCPSRGRRGIDNIDSAGRERPAGDELLTPRTLSAQDIAILAADGRPTVDGSRAGRSSASLSTGTELADPGQAARPAR